MILPSAKRGGPVPRLESETTGWPRVLPLWALLAGIVLLILAIGCGARPIRPDDPLAERLDARRYLAMPISSLDHGFPNVFGPEPVLAAGTQVRVVEILRHREIYFVRYTGPAQCEPHCTLRLDPAADVLASLDARLVVRDPLGGLNETARDLVAAHEIAAGMSAHLVRLSLGSPDRVETSSWLGSPAQRWIYEERSLDESGATVRRPRLAVVLAADRLVEYEDL